MLFVWSNCKKCKYMYKIKCYGIAKDITQKSTIDCKASVTNVAELRNWLNTGFPEFQTLAKYMIAVNEEYALEDLKLNEGDVIAIIPPVSGG